MYSSTKFTIIRGIEVGREGGGGGGKKKQQRCRTIHLNIMKTGSAFCLELLVFTYRQQQNKVISHIYGPSPFIFHSETEGKSYVK
jgi:hypothetical protein